MKNILLSLLFVLSFTILSGQVSKTINLTNAGTLSTGLTSEELNSVTNLTITGNIDARDFKTMRDLMPVLAEIDLSGVNILAYSGTEGTSTIGNESYTANSIPESAFENCSKLTSINLSNGVKILESFSFRFCVSLIDMVLPEGLTSIGIQTFFECKNLSTINIPSSVITIDLGAISYCENLKTITLGSPLPSNFILGQNVFWAINKTTCSLYVPFGSKAAYQAVDQWKDFQNIVEMEPPYKMPLNVTAGGLAALLPQSVRDTMTYLALTDNIDARDFKTMRDLMPVLAEIDLSGATILGYEGLEGTSKSGNTIYPSNTVPENAFESKPTLKNIILPNSTEEISLRAFLYCRQLLSATLPSSLQKINDQAFGWCNSLSSITLPESIKYIGYQSFATTNMAAIEIPQAVEYIGDVVFFQCRSLREINVNTLNIKYSSVEGVLFNKDQTILIAYPGGKTTTEYTIPSGVTKISVRSFEGSKPTKIIIPEGVLHIGFEAFTNMFGLKEINIPASITKIEGGAFAYNQNLTSVSANRIIPLPLYGYGVFDGINKSTCILYVPGGSSELYRNATEWKDFQNIIEYTTYIPDDNFEQALINLGYDSGVLDNYVLTNKISTIKKLSINNKQIIDLTGIQNFVSLEELYCNNNKLTNLDLSKNQNLLILDCSFNNLSSLDVSSNLALTTFGCVGNLLNSIDVSKNLNLIGLVCSANNLSVLDLTNNTKLEYLRCGQNKLTSIDLSKMPSLNYLDCSYNLISSIDVSMNRDLAGLNCSNNNLNFLNLRNGNNANMIDNNNGNGLYVTGNPNLFCIQVDDPALSLTYASWYKDAKASYSSDCEESRKLRTYIPDDNFEQALIDLGYDSGPLNDSVPTFNISGITNLSVSNKNISDLTGIEDFKALKSLDCSYNQLIKLDFGNNLNLTTLYCNNNKLTSLNLKNGHNSNFFQSYKTLDSRNNPQLFCIQVDDPIVFAGYPGVFKDSHSSYSNDCSALPMTYIPDDNFEQALIGLGYDSGLLDDYVPTANISSVTTLSLQNKNIADLTGIEDFSSLERLYLSDNKLTSLDLRQNTKLKILHCQSNQLTSLDISKNTALTEIAPNFNQLTKLDLSNNPGLIKVFCQSNKLTELDISNNMALQTLICYSNHLTNLDVSKNGLLVSLNFNDNNISSIDLSNNIKLKGLGCNNNPLETLSLNKNVELTNLNCSGCMLQSLDISNNKALAYFYCNNNLITSIDLSGHSEMSQLDCSNNRLTVLNLKNGNNTIMSGGGKGLNATNNPNLFCIQVDNPENSLANPQWVKDSQASYSTLCNNIPVANAGADQTGEAGTNVMLDGSFSSDADQDNLTYKWTAQDGITLSSSSAQKPTFIAPEVTHDTQFTFILVVNDGFSDSPADQVVVTVKQLNNLPVADAGADQTLAEGTIVTLDGSLSLDADQDNLTYKWTAPDGITLSSSSTQKPTFIAPEVTHDTQFTFALVVNDGFSDSPADQVVVTVKQVNKTPVADAGSDQIIEEGAVVILDGTLSSDADGDSLIYEWTTTNGIILSSSSAQKPAFTAPEVTHDTQFTFALVVNDGFEDSPADQVVVTVKQVNKTPVANAGADQKVKTGDKVVLNGTGSFDPDQDTLVYSWTSLNGITLNVDSDPYPFFFAPVTKNNSDLIFTLTVSDSSASSKTDTVIISVENKSPVISVKTFFDGTISSAEQVSYELYKETDGKFGKYTATFSSENNTATFNVEEGNWMVLAIPSVTETNFIPTYFGNSITWNEAEVITVQGEEIVDLEIDCQKVKVETTGEYSIEGYVYQDEGTKSCVILSGTKGNNPVPGTKVLLFRENETIPVRTTITDNEGKYIFNSLNLDDYKVIVDIPGFDQVDVWNIKLDSVTVSVKNVNFTVITSLRVITDIPETDLKTSIYPNPTTGKLNIKTENWPHNSKIEVFNSIGKLVYHSLILSTTFMIDLSDKPDGVYIVSVCSNKKKETVKIVLRK